MGFKVLDEVLILNPAGNPVAVGTITNINEFREPAFKYAVDLYGYADNPVFVSKKQLIEKPEAKHNGSNHK